MGVHRISSSSWCFCSGGGKSEKIKGSIFSTKSPAIASIFSSVNGGTTTGFLIHWNLLLTTHANLPSVAAAESAEVRVHTHRFSAVPHRFFITSSVLDLTIVGLDIVDTDSTSHGHQPHYLKTCCNPSLDLGSTVYVLGHTDKKELTVGEGKVVIGTDNLIKLSTDGVTWCPGSAGFDVQGNLAFMVCDPMKLASSPTAKSSSASSSSSLSWKKDSPMQFGIPIPIIRDWLHQYWEGNLDELSKPKLPLIRLMSSGQKSEHFCASFTQRQVFKPAEEETGDISPPSQLASRPKFLHGSSNSANVNMSHEQGIPTPEIYESPRLTSGPARQKKTSPTQIYEYPRMTSEPARKKETAPTQLLDINFPPRVPSSIVLPLPLKQLMMNSDENNVREPKLGNASKEEANSEVGCNISPVGSCQGDCCSEVQSSSSPRVASELRNEVDGFSSGEETMYSAETMESRNFPSPRENKFQQVGRSQSCVNYSRWAPAQRNLAFRKGAPLQKQHSMTPMRKTRSQATSLPQRSHDYFSPTVSSSMKKRNNSEQPMRPRQTAVQVSPRVLLR